MRHGLLFVLLLSAASAAGGQARPWVAPRAADGHPDLQGLWENNSATPLERPAVFAGKPRLTEPELDALKAQAARLFSADADAVFGDAFYLGILENINRGLGATGSYSGNWLSAQELRNPHVAHHRSRHREAAADDRGRHPSPRHRRGHAPAVLPRP